MSGVINAPRRGATSGFALAPLRGANHPSFLPGGLRFASTTGYYLAALRADLSEISFLLPLTNHRHRESARVKTSEHLFEAHDRG